MRLLLSHLVLTAFLCGVIWVIQVVHYPLFYRVDRAGFARFEAEHARRITPIVGPTMVLEAATALWLVVIAWRGSGPIGLGVAGANLLMIALVWASTATMQVPAHARLAGGWDADAHRVLVASNWIRTLLWTARTCGLLALALRAAGR